MIIVLSFILPLKYNGSFSEPPGNNKPQWRMRWQMQPQEDAPEIMASTRQGKMARMVTLN